MSSETHSSWRISQDELKPGPEVASIISTHILLARIQSQATVYLPKRLENVEMRVDIWQALGISVTSLPTQIFWYSQSIEIKILIMNWGKISLFQVLSIV